MTYSSEGLAFGEHDSQVTFSICQRTHEGGASKLTELPVDVLDEHATKVIRNPRETAQCEVFAPRRVMRVAAARARRGGQPLAYVREEWRDRLTCASDDVGLQKSVPFTR